MGESGIRIFGLLVQRGGRWAGRPPVPEAWVADRRRQGSINPEYGLLWWVDTGRTLFPSVPAASFAARGAGSNVIFIDPDHDLVAVVRWIDKSSISGFLGRLVESETAPSPTAGIIWMHALGADGHDFEPIVPELGLQATPVRLVFPHAPMRPVTINNGMVMRAWYDVRATAGERREDEAGVRASQALIEALIAREKRRGIPARRLVLAGFSQGGAMALHTGLRHPQRLAGILALSCFLPLPDALAGEASPANGDVPIFMAHGTHDDVISLARARRSRDVLTGLGYRVVARGRDAARRHRRGNRRHRPLASDRSRREARMTAPVDPNEVLMTGENSFVRLSPDGGKTMTDRFSHWRVLWCPAGTGQALFAKTTAFDSRLRVFSDNAAVARWLQRTIETILFPEFAEPGLPVLAAESRAPAVRGRRPPRRCSAPTTRSA